MSQLATRLNATVSMASTRRSYGRVASLGLAPRAGRGLGVLLVLARHADGDLLVAQGGALERGDDVGRLVRGYLDEREVVVDVDGADLLAAQPGLVGDGADEILGAQAVRAAHGDEEARHAALGGHAVGLELLG